MVLMMMFVLALAAHTSDSFNIICYYTSWSYYRVGKSAFSPEDINPNLCTHINYAFAKYVGLDLVPTEKSDEDIFARLVKLKQQNTELKIVLAVGGDTTRSKTVLQEIANVTARQMLVNNTVNYLRQMNFDGFNVDWKYVTDDGDAVIEKQAFTLLIGELWQAFTKDAERTGMPRLLLGIAVSASKDIIETVYDIEKLTEVVDFINIMSYDYHGNWESVVGFNSPLYANTDEQGAARQHNVNWTVNYYVSLGAMKSKINIGIATYGREFTLLNDNEHSILSPATGFENVSETTRQEGFKPYYEVCDVIHSGGMVVPVPSQGNSYVVKNNQWIGYDDVKSVSEKACYAKEHVFGGVTVWSLNFDDFSGRSCYQGKLPLLSAIYKSQDKETSTCTSDMSGGAVHHTNYSETSSTEAHKLSKRSKREFRVLCYYTNWAQYREGKGKFFPENVDSHLCTHISFAFAKPVGLTIATYEWNDEAMYARMMKLKEYNPKVKILLALGGYNMGSAPFIPLIASDYSRTNFANNAATFLRQRKFDGLDMDWEYPTHKTNFALLMEKIRETFENDARVRGLPRLLLITTVAAGKSKIDSSYDVPRLVRCSDFINVMTYDYHGSWESFVGFNSPLYAHPKEKGNARFLNIDWSVRYYVTLGAPKERLNIGIASYGRSFTLRNRLETDVLSPSTGAGPPGPITRLGGVMSYYEMCDFIASGWKTVYVAEQANSYAYNDDTWVGYDNVQSVTEKTCYARKNGYGGIIVWTLDFDDFLGTTCYEGRYPLLNAIDRGISSCNGSNLQAVRASSRNSCVGNTIKFEFIMSLFLTVSLH